MRVLLLKPPDRREKSLFGNRPARWLYPLRMAYLASGLKQADCNCRFLDCPREGYDEQSAAGAILDFHPDIVYAELNQHDAEKQLQFLSALSALSAFRIVLGGPYAAFFHYYICTVFPAIDAVIQGEPDATLFEILSAWNGGAKIDYLPGISIPGAKKPIVGPPAAPRYDLDSLPFPDRTVVPLRRYQKGWMHKRPLALMAATRGCPQQCTFCRRGHSEHKVRFRDPESVGEEAELLVRRLGVRELRLVDSVFNADPEWSCNVARALAPLASPWYCTCIGACLTGEVLREYRRGGCLDVFLTAVCPNEESKLRLKVQDGPEEVKNLLPLAIQEDIKLHIRVLAGPDPLPSFEEAQWFAGSLSHVDVQIRYVHPHLDAPFQQNLPDELLSAPKNHNMEVVSAKSRPFTFFKQRVQRFFSQPTKEICAENETLSLD